MTVSGIEGGFEDLERRLADERPLPAPGFRSELRRNLVTAEGSTPPRRQLRLQLACCAVAGALLFGLAAAGLVDVGPFDSPRNPLLDNPQQAQATEPGQPTSSATDSS